MKATLTLALILLLTTSFSPEGGVSLRYQFKTGDEYTWVQFKKQSVKQSIMGMNHEMHNNMHGEYLLKVAEVSGGSATIEAQFTKLKVSSRSFVGQITMDSEGPADVKENNFAKSVMKRPFNVVITSRGDIGKIEGASNLIEGLNKVPVEDKQHELMVAMLRQMLSEPALKANFKEVFVVYPEGEVKPGDNWKSSVQPGMNFPMVLESTWTVSEILPGNATINADGVIKTTDKESEMEFAGVKAKADLSGKQTVKATVNLKTGWPYKQDGTADLNGVMKFAAGGMVPADMEVPVQMFYKTTHVIKRKAP